MRYLLYVLLFLDNLSSVVCWFVLVVRCLLSVACCWMFIVAACWLFDCCVLTLFCRSSLIVVR